jgi:DNA-binding PadR family transcriptional regulator
VRDFTRGAVRLHILHHAAEGEINGAWMSAELANHGYRISPGTLYPMLHRMQQDGLLSSEQRVVDGRAVRVYRATDAGIAALAEDRAALAELAREVLPGFAPQHAEQPAPEAPEV